MSDQFANLKMKRIIIHQIFERNESREMQQPRYNSTLSILDSTALSVLQARITDVLGHNSHSIELEVVRTSPSDVFSIATRMIYADEQGFISESKKAADKLAEAQTTRTIPGGILVVFNGTVGPSNDNCVGFIKAEIHEGFSVEQSSTDLLLKFLTDLCLTPQQKLYKIGIFIEKVKPESSETHRIPQEFKVFVYDQNMNTNTTSGAALYFYEVFLGCAFSPSAKKLTMDFYYHTKDFIDQLPLHDEEKVDLHSALYSYLKVSQSNVVDTTEFGDQYLTPEQKDDYCSFMEQNEFPTNAVPKDITLIQSKLRKRKIVFSSNVSLTAPSDNFNDLVQIMGHEGSKTLLKIEGFISEQ